MKCLFFGGSSEIAQKLAKNISEVDCVSRKKKFIKSFLEYKIIKINILKKFLIKYTHNMIMW